MRRSLPRLLLLALCTPLHVAACTAEVKPGKVAVEPTPLRVTVGGGDRFCPPGQAKKGRC